MIHTVRLKEFVALVCALGVIGGALAVWSRQPTLAADKPDDAVSYLEKISSTDALPYHARQLVVYMGLPQSAAVLDIRSTPKATFVRADAGEDVVRLWRRPGTGIVSGAQGAVSDDGVEAQIVRAADVVAKYDVSMGPKQKMLGVDVVPLTLVRRSDQLMTERLWVDPASGVVYRRELYSSSGRLVGLSTIIDMRWGDSGATERFDPAAAPRSHAVRADDGGAPPGLPYSYSLSRAYTLSIGGRTSKQWVYKDGLHALSVFATKGGLRAPAGFSRAPIDGVRAYSGPGPGMWTWEGGGRTWVVVAEEPDLDPAAFIARLPHDAPSAWARMGSLWSKAFSFVGRAL
jgi:hypothetical protein